MVADHDVEMAWPSADHLGTPGIAARRWRADA
jgi:hypothetical protein